MLTLYIIYKQESIRLYNEVKSMTYDQQKFVDEMVKYIQKYAPKYGIKVISPILGQACLESSWGTSELAVNTNNYFGIKHRDNRCPTACGTYVKVGSEQKADGSYESSSMLWDKFPSREACVQGYFDFTNISNYSNLKGVTDPKTYLENIKADKYASSKDYVKKVMDVITANNFTKYDTLNSGSTTKPTEKPKVLYKVQVGAYAEKKNAEIMLKNLQKSGFNGFIVEVKQ